MCTDILKTRNDLSLEEIEELMKQEKNIKVYKKLVYVRFRIMGYSIIESYTLANVKKSTAYYIEDKWNENGYDSLKKKPGQGRKPKLSDENWEEFRKIMSKRNDWTLPELSYIIKKEYGVTYSLAHLAILLRKKLNAHFAKSYSKDYRQSPYYKQSFHLKLNAIFKKYKLQYDSNTGNIINKETNEAFQH